MSDNAVNVKGSVGVDAILPGPVRQIGYVVRDLATAMQQWLAIGVGPWLTLGDLQPKVLWRGEECEVRFSLAFANSGALQIELIQPDGDEPSPFREFLDSKPEGYHQLAWWTEDFEAVRARAESAGWVAVLEGTGSGRYVYYEAPGAPAPILEVMELNDATRAMMDAVRDAADGWDGRASVRQLRPS